MGFQSLAECRDNDSVDVTFAGESFQIGEPTAGKVWFATVDSQTVGTTRRLVPTDTERHD